MNNKNKNKQAFTLVELAIVLVIIGLIVSAVLVGQDLIRTAQTNAIIRQVQGYNSAVNAFRNKFLAIPGDYSQASTYILSTITDGDGNGLIGTGVPGATPLSVTNEMATFWQELSLLALIDGQYTGVITSVTLGTNFPLAATKVGGILAYADTDTNNYYMIGLARTVAAATIATANNLSAQAAFQIDTKLDDGLPTSGTVIAYGATTLQAAASTTAVQGAAGCVYTTPAPDTYNTAADTQLYCQTRIKF